MALPEVTAEMAEMMVGAEEANIDVNLTAEKTCYVDGKDS